jgi:hypothetical protein
LNLGSERDWSFQNVAKSQPQRRSIPLNMGKVLGGGSSINVIAWGRGHKKDWDFFAIPGETIWRGTTSLYWKNTSPSKTGIARLSRRSHVSRLLLVSRPHILPDAEVLPMPRIPPLDIASAKLQLFPTEQFIPGSGGSGASNGTSR